MPTARPATTRRGSSAPPGVSVRAALPRGREGREKNIGDLQIDRFERHNPVPSKNAGDIFDELSRHKPSAARRALEYIHGKPERAHELIDLGRRLIFLKGTDSHDYKFSSAVLEDYSFIAPAWRDRFLAASLFWLKGSGAPDSGLVKRTRAALS